MSRENFLNRMERRFGRYAIPNLTLWICVLQAVGFVLSQVHAGAYETLADALSLDMNAVFHGQVWRIVTFLMVPTDNNAIFFLIMIFFYYSIGKSLEYTLGEFRYNFYIFSGVIFTILGNIAAYFIILAVTGESYPVTGTVEYLLMSLFLAYAFLYPDERVLLYFIIPIKVKWLAYVYYVIVGLEMLQYIRAAVTASPAYWGYVISMVFSLMNFFLFYYWTRQAVRPDRAQRKRQREFKRKMNSFGGPDTGRYETPQGIAKHRCAVCGATELDHPDYQFRFCSKCNGNYEYCQDHLFNHKHVK